MVEWSHLPSIQLCWKMSRSYCYQCHRVKQACFCHHIKQIDNPVSVIVLQHPDESRINKGTAIIAKLSLNNYQCWQGENFSDHKELNELIATCAKNIAIVYPSENSTLIKDYLQQGSQQHLITHVIFIDATWRKAKKIWALSRNLHALPAIKLELENISNYRIRKVPEDGYLSTIEAITHGLASLDGAITRYQPLLDVFNIMIDHQIDQMGSETYNKNYEK